MKFSELDIGDMFGTKPANFVKIDSSKAIVVQSSIFSLGEIHDVPNNLDVVPLYTRKMSTFEKLFFQMEGYCKYLKSCIRWENNHPKTFEEFINK